MDYCPNYLPHSTKLAYNRHNFFSKASTMGLFRQLYKSAFWSQLFLGMVAILALPIVQTPSDTERNTIEQTLTLSELVTHQHIDTEPAYFLSQTDFSVQISKQAVAFCPFLATSYRLDSTTNPPIRAGPIV